jgi:hypothetical protein
MRTSQKYELSGPRDTMCEDMVASGYDKFYFFSAAVAGVGSDLDVELAEEAWALSATQIRWPDRSLEVGLGHRPKLMMASRHHRISSASLQRRAPDAS